ncbi:MAG: hypothetical protein E6Q97_34880 [Desulfurellales bacterium]|nr:MAG: hypothetical protein E6Q97_34880 [Desulfurellales bacterium]
MRKALLALAAALLLLISASCSRSYYHDAGVLSSYQRQARTLCLNADAKTKLSTCRRAKACASAAQAGLTAILEFQEASAKMTATVDDRLAADAAYAGAVAACGVVGISGSQGASGASHDAGTLQDASKPLAPLSDGGSKHD